MNKQMYLKWTLLFLLALGVSPALVSAEGGPGPEPIQCQPGQTMNCLMLGMEAEKQKDFETALTYYRQACRSHPAGLRACTPLLVLSRQMGILDREAAFLEKKCENEGPLTCYYLGKEYLKIRKTDRAIRLLEPLCREGFQPRNKRDFGPCFHLARSFHASKDYERARTFYRLDCGDNIERVHPSCESLRNINLIYALTPERTVPMPSPLQFNLYEGVVFLSCAIPFISVLTWFFGRPSGLWFLRWGGPVIFLIPFLVWAFFLQRSTTRSVDTVLMFFCLITIAVLAFLARRSEPLKPV